MKSIAFASMFALAAAQVAGPAAAQQVPTAGIAEEASGPAIAAENVAIIAGLTVAAILIAVAVGGGSDSTPSTTAE